MRLTEKHIVDNIDCGYKVKKDTCEDGIVQGWNKTDAINKLGQLEDIEQEIGIDLITFVKLNKTDKIYDKEEETFMYFDWIDLENKCLVCDDDFDEMSGGYLHTYYYFKDYGKTWALTKEEMEEK